LLQENYFFILLGFGTNPSGGCATGQTGAEAKLVADAKAAVETNRVAEERASAEALKLRKQVDELRGLLQAKDAAAADSAKQVAEEKKAKEQALQQVVTESIVCA